MILPRFLMHEIKENIGLAFYTKAQQFAINYYCRVKNISSRNIKVAVVFPIPPTTYNQAIKKLKLAPKYPKIDEDQTFGNKYVYWETQIKPKVSKTFKEEFFAEISPIKIKDGKKFRIREFKDQKLYIRNERHVDFENSDVKLFAQKIHPRQNDIFSTAHDLNDFVVKVLNYGHPIDGLYSSVESIKSKQTDCGGFASLLAALLRYNQIPARIVCGYLLAPTSTIMHAWVEFMLPDDRWIPADPTIENLLKKRGTKSSGKFGFIGSDHLTLSYGSDIEIEIMGKTNRLDILQNPVVISSKGSKSIKIESALTANHDYF